MAVAAVIIQPGLSLAASVALLMAPLSTGAQVTNATFSNTSDSNVDQITVYLVRSGGAPGPGNIVIPLQTLAPGQTYVSPELWGRNLNAGDTLWGLATNAGDVNCFIDGFTS